MKHLQGYKSYIKDNNSLILEKSEMKFYKTLQDKIITKLSLGLYFAATYTWGVTMLYPIVDALTKNYDVPNITPEQIVLLTLFSITQILNLANNDVKKIRKELEENNLLGIASKVKESLLSVQKIFSFVSRSFGKVIDAFTDMIAYVGLGIPFTSAIVEIISKEGLNLDTLPKKLVVMGGAVSIYATKSLVETIVMMIKNKMKSNNDLS